MDHAIILSRGISLRDSFIYSFVNFLNKGKNSKDADRKYVITGISGKVIFTL
jgi:hypothetical protein